MLNHEKNVASFRVLYITSRFPALSLTFVANEIKAVTDLGCSVEIFSLWNALSDHDGHPVEKPFLRKVQYAAIGIQGNFKRLLKGFLARPSVLMTFATLIPDHLKSPWLFGKLIMSLPKGLIAGSYALEKKCDHIHAHFISMPTTVALIASKVSGVPYTATAHAFDITSTHPQRVNGSVAIKCKRAAAIVTISEYNKNDILNRWPELNNTRIEVIYNGIDTSAFSPRTQNNTTPTQDGVINVISISNLNEKKGFSYLIAAVIELLDSGRDVKLDIYGDGPLRKQLQDQINLSTYSDKILLKGAIDQQLVEHLCKTSELFVLASVPLHTGDADGLPTVLIESLGSELPSISTQVTGIPEIIVDGKTGRCVPPTDITELSAAIAWMADNPAAARKMAKAGRQLVLEKFDQRNTSKQLVKLWQECRTTEKLKY